MDGSFSWSAVKFSRSAVRVGAGSIKSSDVGINDCLIRNGVPGFEIETKEDAFWSPYKNPNSYEPYPLPVLIPIHVI